MGVKKTTKAVAKRNGNEAAVETVAVSAPAPPKLQERRRRITFENNPAKSKAPSGKISNAAVAARRAAAGGIIEAKKRRRSEEEEEDEMSAEKDEELSDDENDNNDEDEDDNDDLSDLADENESDDDDDNASDEASWENPFEKAKRDGTRLSYSALRLRFLPPEFQEPQLFKFLSQFGAGVLNCFCVRSRRTHQSKGIAYVQFDTESILETVVEECHGMSLGGRAVQAHRVTLHRPMPTKEKVMRRRRLAYAYKTRGAPLRRHDVRQKSPIAALIKYTQSEKENNDHLKRLGIDYAYHGFEEQLAKVPRELILSKKQLKAQKMKNTEKRKGGKGVGKKLQGKVIKTTTASVKNATVIKEAKKGKLAPVKSAPASKRPPARKVK